MKHYNWVFVYCFAIGVIACDDANTTGTKGLEHETETESDQCPAGTAECPCTPEAQCAIGLVCLSNVCQTAANDDDTGTELILETDETTESDSEENGTDTAPQTDSESECALGAWGCACIPSAMCGMGTCNAGLVCDSFLCIRPEDVETENNSSPESDADADACGDIDLDYSKDSDRMDNDSAAVPDVNEI